MIGPELLATEAAPKTLGVRLRRDIAWTRNQDSESDTVLWVAQDPLTRRWFRCGDHEYQLLQWLDHDSSIDKLEQRFNDSFSPRSIERSQIQSLIARCTDAGLMRTSLSLTASHATCSSANRIQIPSPTQDETAHRWWLRQLHRAATMLQRIVQMQWTIGSPDRWLEVIAPKMGWLYSRPAVLGWGGLSLFAMVLVLLRVDQLWAEMPSIDAIRSPGILVGYGVVFFLTRFAHEFGHAVVCKRFGAACRDVGLIMSYGMICPYVDITDGWRIGNRFARMQIALAGIYTECMIASVSAMVWYATYPGWLHQLAFQTMLVCSIATLLFNANPLMKYDGYFVLCDWLNTQNLRERSFRSIDRWLAIGRSQESTTMTLFLLFYLIASTLNRLMVLLGVVSLVLFVGNQWNLSGVGIAFLAVSFLCSLAVTLSSFSGSPSNGQKWGRRASWLGWGCTALLLAWALNMPLPNRVHSIGEIRMGDRIAVYTGTSGRIVSSLGVSTPIAVGQNALLLRQDNPWLQKSCLELEGKLIRLEQHLTTLDRLAFFNDSVGDQRQLLQSQIEMVAKQLTQKQEEQQKLEIYSSEVGTFFPSRAIDPVAPENPSDRSLGVRSCSHRSPGTWTDEAEYGRHLDRGTLIGWLVRGSSHVVECKLTDEQRLGIQIGSIARVRLYQHPTNVLHGRVVSISLAKQFAPSQSIKTTTTESSSNADYVVGIELDNFHAPSPLASGTAEVVLLRPTRSLISEATDFWMRNIKMR